MNNSKSKTKLTTISKSTSKIFKTLKKSSSSNIIFIKKKNVSENLKVIEDYKKICYKHLLNPNEIFLEQLSKNQINIYIDNYTLKEINVISKLLENHFSFKHIRLGNKNPNKKEFIFKNQNTKEKEKNSKEKKDERDKKLLFLKKKNSIIKGLSTQINLSLNILSISITDLYLSEDCSIILSKGLSENNSIQRIAINNCNINLKPFEIIIGSLLNHTSISYIDLSYNNLKDKYGKILGRIISRQNQRRDQILWENNLRNEKSIKFNGLKGLISLGLKGNLLNEITSFYLCNSLLNDNYIRAIDLSENNLNKESCKNFIRIMRKNTILLNIDLKNNPGYDEEIHARIVMKMSKNIKILYSNYLNDEFSEDEFNEIKGFINQSFFDVDIPEKIIDVYNSNFEEFKDKDNSDNEDKDN